MELNNKHFEKLALTSFIVIILITILGISISKNQGEAEFIRYTECKLFDQSYVHQIDIEVDGFQDMLDNCFLEEYRPCDITIDGETFYGVGIRCKGNSSMESVVNQGLDRHSFKIEFDQYDKTKSYYGLDKLVLNNCESDYTYMIDYLVFSLMNETGADAPLCSYSFINVNGEPWGLYMSIESIEDGLIHRLYGNSADNLYKPDNPPVREMEGITIDKMGYPVIPKDFDWTVPDVRLEYRGNDFDKYKNIFSWAKTDINSADKARLIESLRKLSQQEDLENILDIENIIRFFAVHNFVYNEDGYNGIAVHNYYLYELNGKLNMLPWDYGLAFGTYKNIDEHNAINDPIDSPIDFDINGKRPMFEWIVTDEVYRQQYHQAMQELVTYLKTSNIEHRIDSLHDLIYEYLLKQKVEFCTIEQFEEALKHFKLFFRLRIQSIEGQLAGELPINRTEIESNPDKYVDTTGLDLRKLGWRSRT